MFGDVRSKGIMHRRQTGRGYEELRDVYNLLITAPFPTLKQRFAELLSRTLGIVFLQSQFWFAVWLFNYRKANRCAEETKQPLAP